MQSPQTQTTELTSGDFPGLSRLPTSRRVFIMLAFVTAVTWLVPGIVLAQGGDPLDNPFSRPQFLVHISETATISGPLKKDVYILYAQAPSNGILLTPDGTGGQFINKAEQVGGPFGTKREACNAARGISPKAASDIGGCPASTSSTGGKVGSAIVDFFLPIGGRERLSDAWDSMTAKDASAGERVVGTLSLTGGVAEMILTILGAVALSRWLLKKFFGAAAKEGAELLGKTVAAELKMAVQPGEDLGVQLVERADEFLGNRNLLKTTIEEAAENTKRHILNIEKARGITRVGRQKLAEMVTNALDCNGQISATQFRQQVYEIVQEYFTGGSRYDEAAKVWVPMKT